MECENCERLRREVDALEYRVLGLKDGLEERDKLKAEVDALERRNEELEDELQGIKDDPSVLMEDWSGDLD